MARHVEKFRGVMLFPKVTEAHTLNFKVIFNPSLQKNCWGDPHFRQGVR